MHRTAFCFLASAAALACCSGAASHRIRSEARAQKRLAPEIGRIAAGESGAPRRDGGGTTAGKIPFERNDTLFFCDCSRQDSATGFRDYCRVFVDGNRSSANYDRLRRAASLDTESNRRDFEELAAALNARFPGRIRRFDLRGCPEVWQRLVSVAGEYYLDGLNRYPVRITDSLFVEQMQDGPWPSLLEAFEEPEPGHYRFRVRTLHDETRRFDLYLADSPRPIALLVEHDDAAERYRLLAAGEASSHFDLLVWESAEMPSGNEIPYDAVDFEALMTGKQRK